jgi:hypothetical protein
MSYLNRCHSSSTPEPEPEPSVTQQQQPELKRVGCASSVEILAVAPADWWGVEVEPVVVAFGV